jgi:hypothetical protein
MVGNSAAKLGSSDELSTTALGCRVVGEIGIFKSFGVLAGSLVGC